MKSPEAGGFANWSKSVAQRRRAARLLLDIEELCDCSGDLTGQTADRGLKLTAELRTILHMLRLPPFNDYRAAVAYSYVSMLKPALESRNGQMARMELFGMLTELLSPSGSGEG